MIGEPKILLFDLETMPNLEEVMRVLPSMSDYPGLTLKASINSIICCGYKLFGQPEKPECINAWDFKSWKKNINDDREIVKHIRDLISNVDAVVTHNGMRFDWKFLQTRIMIHGFDPLPKIPHIDTCQLAKRHTMFFNNRLNTLSKFLANDQKLENGGWELWVKVMNRDKSAMKTMTEYCIQDVVVLEKIFKKLRPFATQIPNYNLFLINGKKPVCPSCGSTRIGKNGTRITRTAHQVRLVCKDCGSHSHVKIEGQIPKPY